MSEISYSVEAKAHRLTELYLNKIPQGSVKGLVQKYKDVYTVILAELEADEKPSGGEFVDVQY